MPKWLSVRRQTTHPSNNHLIVTRPGVQLTTSRLQVWWNWFCFGLLSISWQYFRFR